jgi:hypothetical protein
MRRGEEETYPFLFLLVLKLLLLDIFLFNASFDGGKRLPRKWPESTALFFTGSFRTFRHSRAGRAGGVRPSNQKGLAGTGRATVSTTKDDELMARRGAAS